MAIVIRCPGCDTRFEFDDDLEGKRIRCKNCGDTFRIEKPVRQKRRAEEDDDDDRPSSKGSKKAAAPAKKKMNPLLIIGPGIGILLLVVVTVVLLVKGKKKAVDEVTPADTVKAPSKTCPLQVVEKDVEQIIAPDRGTVFAILRKTDRRNWNVDIYDAASGTRRDRLELLDQDEPHAISLSPDGKRVMIQERDGHGVFSKSTLSVYDVAKKQTVHPEPKWVIYAGPAKARDPFKENDTLYRAEFLGNDQIVAISKKRKLTTWTLSTMEPTLNTQYRATVNAKDLGEDDGSGSKSLTRYQKEVAYSADRSKAAMWYGDGYVLIDLKEGFELFRTDGLAGQGYERAKSGAVAFSADGKMVAGLVEHGFREYTLMVWDTSELKPATKYSIKADHLKDMKAIAWWGNKYVVTLNGGEGVEGILINVQNGSPTRQLMIPRYKNYAFGRDGRLWYPTSGDDTGAMANVLIVDPVDTELAGDPDLIEEVPPLKGTYLRRLWMEPTGILRKPTRENPPRGERLIVMTSGER